MTYQALWKKILETENRRLFKNRELLATYGLEQREDIESEDFIKANMHMFSALPTLKRLEGTERFENRMARLENEWLIEIYGYANAGLRIFDKYRFAAKCGGKSTYFLNVPNELLKEIMVYFSTKKATTGVSRPARIKKQLLLSQTSEMVAYRNYVKKKSDKEKQMKMMFSKDAEMQSIQDDFTTNAKKIEKTIIYGKAIKELKKELKIGLREDMEFLLQIYKEMENEVTNVKKVDQ